MESSLHQIISQQRQPQRQLKLKLQAEQWQQAGVFDISDIESSPDAFLVLQPHSECRLIIRYPRCGAGTRPLRLMWGAVDPPVGRCEGRMRLGAVSLARQRSGSGSGSVSHGSVAPEAGSPRTVAVTAATPEAPAALDISASSRILRHLLHSDPMLQVDFKIAEQRRGGVEPIAASVITASGAARYEILSGCFYKCTVSISCKQLMNYISVAAPGASCAVGGAVATMRLAIIVTATDMNDSSLHSVGGGSSTSRSVAASEGRRRANDCCVMTGKALTTHLLLRSCDGLEGYSSSSSSSVSHTVQFCFPHGGAYTVDAVVALTSPVAETAGAAGSTGNASEKWWRCNDASVRINVQQHHIYGRQAQTSSSNA